MNPDYQGRAIDSEGAAADVYHAATEYANINESCRLVVHVLMNGGSILLAVCIPT